MSQNTHVGVANDRRPVNSYTYLFYLKLQIISRTYPKFFLHLMWFYVTVQSRQTSKL